MKPIAIVSDNVAAFAALSDDELVERVKDLAACDGFYEAFGAERLHSESGEFHGGYGWRDLGTLIARCDR